MNATPEKIKSLCDDFFRNVIQHDGSLRFTAESNNFRLLNNGISFESLNHDSLSAAIVGLTKVLLLPGLNTCIDTDHYALWSWCGELLLGPFAKIKLHNNVNTTHELINLYETTVRASLSHCKKQTHTSLEDREADRARLISEAMNPDNSTIMANNSHLILGYLTFPLLEGLLKKSCSKYVEMDGTVITEFEATNYKGGLKKITPPGPCSSLKSLLELHYKYVASQNLKNAIDSFRDVLSTLDSARDPFDLIQSWRNQSLHGTTNFQTIGGTMLNLCLLISVHEIEAEFESYRSDANSSIPRSIRMGNQGIHYFPPPCLL